jgi:hypothetical protein
MKNRRGGSFLFTVPAVALVGFLGCATPQTQTPAAPTGSSGTCIQGVVSYVNPVTSAMVPYPSAAVTAWRHGKDQGLAEVKADRDGKYCIEVPAGSNTVDIRVWGLELFEGNNYVCEGSANQIDLGSMTGKCGSGNCLKVDVRAECRERAERRRGF